MLTDEQKKVRDEMVEELFERIPPGVSENQDKLHVDIAVIQGTVSWEGQVVEILVGNWSATDKRFHVTAYPVDQKPLPLGKGPIN